MLDNLVGERVERRRNQVLFERKGAKLRELNRDLAQESSELEALALRRLELLKAEGKRYENIYTRYSTYQNSSTYPIILTARALSC